MNESPGRFTVVGVVVVCVAVAMTCVALYGAARVGYVLGERDAYRRELDRRKRDDTGGA